ncbi:MULTISPECIES: hypothetical protein [unclassified Pseudoalteromonas]|jgi:hypothetical protein|uniref:hypothetical protein n=1 Tax=unclassified Pseudoalteromonas TaxID=194690 RepID=UPI0023585D6C|nr:MULTISPECIES: hypothetical protein [unclassified Pseudoalteromonas]MDC9502956.1 hypothetical protein [Pseudoalteromonas sp. Angola-18]MDC9530222.1 hypothetical protein [Pseudoalteromonas sp. Angola-7]
MSIAIANIETMNKVETPKKTKYFMIALAVACVIFSTLALAAGSGTEWNTIYTTFDGWVKGIPGKTISLLAFFYSVYNITQQNYTMAAGAFLGAVLMVNAGAVLDLIFTAGIPGL